MVSKAIEPQIRVDIVTVSQAESNLVLDLQVKTVKCTLCIFRTDKVSDHE